jgi:hypothetical protein
MKRSKIMKSSNPASPWLAIAALAAATVTGRGFCRQSWPFQFAKLNKLTLKFDRPKITDDNADDLDNGEVAAFDARLLRYVQGSPQ